MPQLKRLYASDQVAAHLREELLSGKWTTTIPGVIRLEEELGVNRKTVESALRQLETEGLIANQGPGRRRRIVMPSGNKAHRRLRVAILTHESYNTQNSYMIEAVHQLEAAGHIAFYPDKSLLDLGMDPKRIARLVSKTPADAWVVSAGSRKVLEWFCEQPQPAFALFGHREGLPIASVGPDKAATCAAATRHLIKLGHRRIVLLVRKARRRPKPGVPEQAVLDTLAAHGIPTSDYNLPDWEETKAGFASLFEAMFKHTPPTAIILDEAPFFAAAQQFLAMRGILAPRDVSLICTDTDPTFAWCEPTIAHITWPTRPVVLRIVRWANNISRGKEDIRQSLTKAEYIDGGTVGPVNESN